MPATINITHDQLDTLSDQKRPTVTLTDEQIRDAYRSMCWRGARDLTQSVADDVVTRIKSGDVTADDLPDAIHEACDGCLIYTRDCVEYLWGSDADANDEASDAGITNPDEMTLAFFALRADVTEELTDRGYGYNGEGWDDEDSTSDDTPGEQPSA